MSLGPIEIIVVGFPENQFTGEIVPALTDLVESGIVRIVDLVFIAKDDDGAVAAVELNALLVVEHVWAKGFADAVSNSGGLLLDSIRIPRDVIDELTA